MSVVLVTGGTGTLGSHAVSILRERGHEVRVLSRRAGAGTHVGDLGSGHGVRRAVDGAELVLHAATDIRRAGRGDADQTRHLLAACAGVRHLLYVSIVGIEHLPYRYYRRKLACEQLVTAGTVGHTVLRATQFHELLARGLCVAERLPLAPLPLRWQFQSVAAFDVAQRAAELLEGPALGRATDYGGPEVSNLAELTAIWRRHRRRPRAVVDLPIPGRLSRALREGANTCPSHAGGQLTWDQFVTASLGR